MMNTKYKPFADANVRLAVKYAIDSSAIAKTALFGYGQPACSILPPSMPYYAKVTCPNNDVAMAKQTLAKSAYPSGFSVDLLIPAASGEANTIAQLAQSELAAIGIKVKIVTVDKSQLYTVQSRGNYQMVYQAWSSDIPDPDEQLSFMLDPGVGGGDSYSTYYNNPRIVSLLAQARSKFDTAKRAVDYQQAQDLNAQDGPFVPLTFEPFVAGWSNSVHGMNQLGTGMTYYQNIWMSGAH
jgi:peptide/nickel transport system substrate-binding protein